MQASTPRKWINSVVLSAGLFTSPALADIPRQVEATLIKPAVDINKLIIEPDKLEYLKKDPTFLRHIQTVGKLFPGATMDSAYVFNQESSKGVVIKFDLTEDKLTQTKYFLFFKDNKAPVALQTDFFEEALNMAKTIK